MSQILYLYYYFKLPFLYSGWRAQSGASAGGNSVENTDDATRGFRSGMKFGWDLSSAAESSLIISSLSSKEEQDWKYYAYSL